MNLISSYYPTNWNDSQVHRLLQDVSNFKLTIYIAIIYQNCTKIDLSIYDQSWLVHVLRTHENTRRQMNGLLSKSFNRVIKSYQILGNILYIHIYWILCLNTWLKLKQTDNIFHSIWFRLLLICLNSKSYDYLTSRTSMTHEIIHPVSRIINHIL